MDKEQYRQTIKQTKKELVEKLSVLYAIFNKTDLSIAGQRELELGKELEIAKERHQVLLDRQVAIGGVGHRRYCPCCGLKLTKGYFKNLESELKEQEEKVGIMEKEYNSLAEEREQHSSTPLTREIAELERQLEEVKQLEKEARDAKLI